MTGALAAAQTGLPPEIPREILDLSRIKAKMRESLSRVPFYTCLETVERLHRAKGKREFRSVDKLRLEVTRIGDDEFYSWPEARRFEGNVDDVVHGGAISTGEYSGHAINAFANPATQIQFSGRETYKGHVSLKYDFQLASFASGWRLNVDGKSGIVAVNGSFWADAESLDLLRLDSHAEDIPPELPITAASSRIDYAIMRIGETAVVLPESAQLQLAEPDGEDRNQVEFSQCRPFTAQSRIYFGAAPPPTESAPARIEETVLPPSVSLALELTQPIDSETSFEGDAIKARVSTDVKYRGKVLIAKGATVRGRLRRLERYSDPVEHFIVGLEFVEIESSAKRWIFRGLLDRIDPLPGLSWVLSTKRGEMRLTSGRGGPLDMPYQVIRGEKLYTADLPGVGTFFLEGTQFRLPVGLHMVWHTTDGAANQ